MVFDDSREKLQSEVEGREVEEKSFAVCWDSISELRGASEDCYAPSHRDLADKNVLSQVCLPRTILFPNFWAAYFGSQKYKKILSSTSNSSVIRFPTEFLFHTQKKIL